VNTYTLKRTVGHDDGGGQSAGEEEGGGGGDKNEDSATVQAPSQTVAGAEEVREV
jgi:hypothetical protein